MCLDYGRRGGIPFIAVGYGIDWQVRRRRNSQESASLQNLSTAAASPGGFRRSCNTHIVTKAHVRVGATDRGEHRQAA